MYSREFFENIFDAIGEGISIQGTDFKVLYQNRKHKDLVGDHAGEYCYKAYELKDEICEGCPVALAFKDGEVHKVERKMVAENGVWYVEITASPLKDKGGAVIGGIELARNITSRRQMADKLVEYKNRLQELVELRTDELFKANAKLKAEIAERRHAEAALRKSEEKYRDLFENAVDPIFIVGADRRYKDVNKRAVELFGYSKEEFLSMGIFDVIPPEQIPRSENELEKLKREGAYEKFIGKMRKKDGFWVDVEVSSSAIIEEGMIVGSRDIVRDITERKRAEQKERMAELGAVAAKIAHDLRNPLVSIGGFAKRLKNSLSGSPEEYAGIIIKEAQRLEGTLKDILGFIREGQLQKEPVDLAELLEDIVAPYEDELAERRITLLRELAGPLRIDADPFHLGEALASLVINAMQAIGSEGTIGFRAAVDGPHVEITLSDTGPGIAERDLYSVFKPFFTTKVSGTGLGLTIAKRIIQEHEGTLDISSKAGRGTTIVVRIPGAQV